MRIKVTLQDPGKEDAENLIEKVIEGEDGQAIWNLMIFEVAELFPQHDKNTITLEKKVPDPIFIAKSEEGEILCHVLCEQL